MSADEGRSPLVLADTGCGAKAAGQAALPKYSAERKALRCLYQMAVEFYNGPDSERGLGEPDATKGAAA